jgi:putative Mg2+ transporter-C (MgtC) family protein
LPYYLTDNFFEYVEPSTANVLLALISVFAGFLIGYEREIKNKPAGIKTMVLVSLGSTTFSLLSHLGAASGDPNRLAAQIVTGVGFLGAGAVMHGGSVVKGLTTAATIWAMAAIGMVIGFGFPWAAIGLSVLVFAVLRGASVMEMKFVGKCQMATAHVTFHSNNGKGDVKVFDILEDFMILRSACHINKSEDGLTTISFSYCNSHKFHKDFLRRLAELQEVHTIV